MGIDRIGENVEKRGSFAGDAWISTDYANDYIARGQAFELSVRIPILASGNAYIWIDYTAYTDLTPVREGEPNRIGDIVILPPYFAATAGPVFIDVSRAPTVTAGTGTLLTTIRKNTKVENYPQIEWRLNPTIVDEGLDPFEFMVGTQGQGTVPGGGDTTTGGPFYRENTSSTLVKIRNQNNTNAITFYYNQVWYEI